MQGYLHYADLAKFTREKMETAIQSRVQTVNFGDGRILTRVLGGPKMFLSPTDLGFSCHVMMDGYWESWLTLFFARHISAGMTVFDVGANFGYYTVLFGSGVGPTGQVIAIEPVPTTAAFLRDTVQLNGFSNFTRVIEAAATASSSQVVHLVIPYQEPKNATIVADARAGSIVVPTCTIDDLAADLSRVDLIKIDVEGAEIDVVAGMRETIKRHRPSILLEYNAARYADPKGFLEELLGTYGSVSSIGWDGAPVPVSTETVLSTHFGEDWLLFFSRSAK